MANGTTKFEAIKSKKPISWRRLMGLRQTGEEDVFESTCPAWPPAPHKRAFGGHVYAQAVCAASRTVDEGLIVHQVTGYFLLPGAIDIPYVYRVRRIRDGGMYCLRGVDVYQNSEAAGRGKSPCFVSTVSFKRSEQAVTKWVNFDYHNTSPNHINQEYEKVLQTLSPEDHPLAPGADALWWEEEEEKFWALDAAGFPGVETRKVDMTKYNNRPEAATSRWRQLIFYRLIQDDDDDEVDPDERAAAAQDLNLHAAAHCYASDRNSLFLIQRAMGHERVRTTMASLSHTVIFHGPARAMGMVGADGRPRWFVQESWTSHGGDNRGCHNSLLWDYSSPQQKVVATTIQDGMIRFPADLVAKVKRQDEEKLRAAATATEKSKL